MKRYLVAFLIFTVLFLFGSFSYSGNMGNFGNQLLQSGKQMLQEKVTKNTPLEKLPDLTVTKIVKIKNKPLTVNDNRQGFVVFIKNIGSKDVKGQYIYVKFTYGNKTIIKKFYGLAMNHTKELKVAPVAFAQGDKNYSITAEVDYNNEIKEKNENNNKLSKTFYVGDALIIKKATVELGKSAKYLFVKIELNRPLNNIKDLTVQLVHAFGPLVEFHHKVNRTTYVFGPINISYVIHELKKMKFNILFYTHEQEGQIVVKLRYAIKSQSFTVQK